MVLDTPGNTYRRDGREPVGDGPGVEERADATGPAWWGGSVAARADHAVCAAACGGGGAGCGTVWLEREGASVHSCCGSAGILRWIGAGGVGHGGQSVF